MVLLSFAYYAFIVSLRITFVVNSDWLIFVVDSDWLLYLLILHFKAIYSIEPVVVSQFSGCFKKQIW